MYVVTDQSLIQSVNGAIGRDTEEARDGAGQGEDVVRPGRQHLNLMHEGISSLSLVDFRARGADPSTLLSLSLHSNRVSSTEGLAHLTTLKSLNLSSNELDGTAIRLCAPHLGVLTFLETLDLSCNRINSLLGLPCLPHLQRLLLPYNRLSSLDGVQSLASSLVFLDVRDNHLNAPVETHAPHLAALGNVTELLMMSPRGGQANPLCFSGTYRGGIFASMRSLVKLDGRSCEDSRMGPDQHVEVDLTVDKVRRWGTGVKGEGSEPGLGQGQNYGQNELCVEVGLQPVQMSRRDARTLTSVKCKKSDTNGEGGAISSAFNVKPTVQCRGDKRTSTCWRCDEFDGTGKGGESDHCCSQG
ncbi:unnamed protein product, partial [Choristocarpus tenellus]